MTGAKVCVILLLVVSTAAQSCSPPDSPSSVQYSFQRAHQVGDDTEDYLYLGGLFGVHYSSGAGSCGEIRTRGVHNQEAFMWAVRTYQSRHPYSLANIRIGAVGLDSCSSSFRLLQQVANLEQCLVGYGQPPVSPNTLLAFVGPDRSVEAMELSAYLGRAGPPQVSHAATSHTLSDKAAYPYFLRTVPSDVVQVDLLLSILHRKGWQHVQLLTSQNAYGRAGRQAFLSAAESAGVCVVNQQEIPASLDSNALDNLLDSLLEHQHTRAVVVFANEDYARALLGRVAAHNIRGLFTWLGTTAWGTSQSVVTDVEDVAEGAVTLTLADSDAYRDFDTYFKNLRPDVNEHNTWFREYWSQTLRCYFPDIANPNGYSSLCDDVSGSLREVTIDPYVAYTIQAVDAILDGLDWARRNRCTLSSDGLCDNLINGPNRWQVIYDSILYRNRFVSFDNNTGNPQEALFEVHNYRSENCNGHCYTKIGDYRSQTRDLHLIAQEIYTYDILGSRMYGVNSTCGAVPCLPCGDSMWDITSSSPDLTTTEGSQGPTIAPVSLRQDSWVIPLIVLAGIGIFLLIVFDAYLLSKIFRSPYMKHWRTMWLGQLLLIGILLSYMTLFAFVPTPTTATCGIIRFGVGASYSMCYSVLLVKLMIVLSSESVGYLKGVFQVLMFLFAWGVQLAADTQWLILRRPNAIPHPDYPEKTICEHADFEAHVQSLVYVMFLIFICTVLSIRSNNIITNHREGVFIGLCAGFSIPVWLVWVLLGIFQEDKAYQDPCLAFGLFTTATLLLFVMYLPKVRQLNNMGVEGIYMEDDSPSMDHTGSVMQAEPVSVVTGYTQAKTEDGSVVLVPNGEMYAESIPVKPVYNHRSLRGSGMAYHRPHNIDTSSIQSAPIGPAYVLRRPIPEEEEADHIHATTRVLRMTNDLTGRRTPVLERRTHSDVNVNVQYGSVRGTNSRTKATNGGTRYTVKDLGAL